ncbi:MAG: HAD-IA family hydrolase [Clostridia bacterium]|nr:HAD-IA family hydrolase [Clostridia bacterium]
MIKYILFDLDATLLPLRQDEFLYTYLDLVSDKLAQHGYDKQKMVESIKLGLYAMMNNDGTITNEQAFWNCYTKIYGEEAKADEVVFDDFYRNEFNIAKKKCSFENPQIPQMVKKLKQDGFILAIATNPVFPTIATYNRINWANLNVEDFEFFTTYEHHSFCKPNPMYYVEVLKRLGAKPEECLMVGNDVEEDMVAEKAGIKVFLLTDCLVNHKNQTYEQYPQGNVDDLMEFISKLN